MAVGGKVKGITIEFNGDTSKLGAALKEIDNKAKGVDKSLSQVNRALRFNPKNTELVAQKQTLLKQKIEQTEKSLEALKAAQKKLDDDPSVENDSQEYMELRREIITTESKLKHFEAEQKKLNNYKFTQLGKSFQQIGGKISSVGRSMTTTFSIMSGIGIYAGKKLIESSQKQAQAEQKLAEIYKTRMGVDKRAVKSSLELASAQQKVGVVGDEIQIAAMQQLATYSKTPATVNKMLPALNNLLVQQKGLNGTQEDAVGLANLFGKAMMGQTGALKRAGISFSKAQEEILKTGTEEEKAAMIAEVVTQNVGHMNEEFAKTDAGKIQQAKNNLGDMGEEIGAVLLPAVADLVKWLQDKLMPKFEEFIEWLKQHPQIAKFALALTGIMGVAGPLLIFIGKLVTAIGAIIKILPALRVAFSTAFGPIGLIVAGAIAGAILIWKNWDKVKKFLIKIWTAIKTAAAVILNSIVGFFRRAWASIKAAWSGVKTFFTGIWSGIKNAFKNVASFFGSIFSRAWSNIKSAFRHVGSFFGGIWQKIKDKFTSLGTKIGSAIGGAVASGINGVISFIENTLNKGIHLINGAIKLINKVLPKKHELGKIKDLKLPRISWHKKGGIFDSPSVIGVGEAGAEAVVPLDKFWKKLDAMGESQSIVINVYGSDNMSVNELATAVQNKIIQMQNRKRMSWA